MFVRLSPNLLATAWGVHSKIQGVHSGNVVVAVFVVVVVVAAVFVIFSHKNLSINLKSSATSALPPTNMRVALSQVYRCTTPKC